MTRRIPRTALYALSCALALGGCARASSESRVVAHPAASTSGVRLAPNPAFAASRIEVAFEDPWVDPAKCRFEWRRNGAVIEGVHGNALDPSHFARGERITVLVTIEDPAGGNPRELTAEVAVVNTPPRVTQATLFVSASSGSPEIVADVASIDVDADPVTYSYRWLRNDSPIDGATGASLAATGLTGDDRVVLEVVATDSESSSPAFRSEPFRIDNLPPRFSSQPVKPRTSDEAFRYLAKAEDPDGDPLRYELVSAPAGMTVEPDGLINWRLPPAAQRRGDHPVIIRVTDSKGGEATQEFTLQFAPPGESP
jgi:hypothetical protein